MLKPADRPTSGSPLGLDLSRIFALQGNSVRSSRGPVYIDKECPGSGIVTNGALMFTEASLFWTVQTEHCRERYTA